VTAADFQAVAESIAAVAALIAVGALGWVTGLPAALVSWSRVRMRREDSLLFSREVVALPQESSTRRYRWRLASPTRGRRRGRGIPRTR